MGRLGGTMMNAGRVLTPYFDLKEKTVGKSEFFFLEHILRARVELQMESGTNECDQELNIYLAGLLNNLIQAQGFIRQKPYLSPFDIDIRRWLKEHPGLRNAYTVYRDNADFSLLLLGIFVGHEHQGSYYNKVFSDQDELGRIALYYELAASALAHLQGTGISLVGVLEALSDHLEEIIKILKFSATSYFDLFERMSDGSVFHLEREIDRLDEKKKYNEKLDEFLKCYTTYKENPTQEGKDRLFTSAYEVKKINSKFSFDGM
jgi:hypothetical protein